MKRILLALIACVLLFCVPKESKVLLDPEVYRMEIDAWHQKRIENLRGPNGWLNLAGLFWLHDGMNTFGAGQANDIIFPEGRIPERGGYFLLKEKTVTLETAAGANITVGGQPLKRMVVFHPDSSRASVQESGSLQWFIIKRDDKYGVRLRDFKNPELENFMGIDRYPVDINWRLEATFVKADSFRTIDITNILGQTTPQRSPGTLTFKLDGKEYRLDALDEGGEEYFMIFGDSTNTKETYGAGRYLYVQKPEADGKAIIDFNKAYNPPCAFTSFATCPLPPKQNVLEVAITAGEKNYGSYPHKEPTK